MSRSSLSGRSPSARVLLVFVAAVALLAFVLGLQPARSFAAKAPRATKQQSHGAIASATGKLVAQYTTAYSDTYQLPDGHMLTRVFAEPVNRRGADGAWQALPAGSGKASSASSTAVSGGGAVPAAKSRPPGSEDELACTIDEATPSTSECNAATFQAGFYLEKTYNGDYGVHGLLQFALPNLHSEVTVLSAELELYETASTTTSKVAMGVYRVITPWGKGVTWNTTNGSTPWKAPGGDFAEPGSPKYAENPSVGTGKGWLYWYPTQFVQEWLNGTDAPNGEGQPNLGFLMKDVTEYEVNNIVSFAGREQADYPGLSFEWVQRGIGNATNYTMLPVPVSKSTSINVNAASGNLMVQSTDLTVPSKAMPFNVARTFNSLAPSQPGYGSGWTDDNTPYIQVGPDGSSGRNGSVLYTDATGNTFVFLRDGAPPAGIEATMCEVGLAGCPSTLPKGATYALEYTKSGRTIYFADAAGKNYPLSMEYAGDLTTAHYTKGLEQPTSWTDSLNETIAYTESATQGYTKVTDETSKASVSYTEKADAAKLYKLVEVVNASKEKTTYTYGSGAEEGLPTKIEEPGGVIVNITYDSAKQVTKITTASTAEHPTGTTTTYTYYEVGKAPSPCTSTQKATVVTETEGNEEPTLIYCANVLDEVENVSGYSSTGQAGWSALEEEPLSETETASVNLDSGDLLVKAEDVKPEAADQNLPLDRYYNSQATSAAGTLGQRWRWGTGPSVYLVNRGDIVVLHGPSGYTVVLKSTSESTYSAPEEFEGTLTKNANGTYTLVDEDNPTYQFNAAGVLTSETTEEGNTFTVNDETLSGKSVLHSLAPVSGKALEVTYNGTPLVTQTTNPAGGVGKYEYNGSGQLAAFTAPSGTKTEYEYSNGYLSKIKTPEATETITTTSGKVSEISVTRTGETGTSGEKFTYEAAKAPTCNPPSDVEETIVTQVPDEAKTSFCFNARGENTTPRTTEQNEVEGEGEQPEISPEACKKEHPGTYCGEEEVPPESNEEEGADAILNAGQPAGIPALVPRKKELEPSRYAIADNNRVTEREGHHAFDIFTNPYFQALHVVSVRRTIPWNLVYEAERGPIPGESEEAKQAQQYAKGLLEDVEEWIIEVKKLDGGLGQPVITFDHCLEPGHWINPEPEAKDASVACDEAAKPLAYTLAIEAFLKRKLKENSKDKGEKIVGEEFGHLVHRYTAWNEPDDGGLVPGSTTEHVEPTYNQPKLAGEYWFDLDELCRGDKYDCEVAAGDFLDSALPDALHEKHLNHEPNPGYTYMKEYLAGTHYPRQINRWAWHAYEDGAETHLKLKGKRKKWWPRFKDFAEVVAKYDPQANIWLLEQGAVFTLPRTEAKTQKEEEEKRNKEIATGARLPEGALGEAEADEVLSAYISDGKYRLTSIDKQIKWFYYYQMRAEDKPKFQGFDSGLLEEQPTKEGEETYNKKPASAPRDIYSVYKNKTPKS